MATETKETNIKEVDVSISSLSGAKFFLRNRKEQKNNEWVSTEEIKVEMTGVFINTRGDIPKVIMSPLELATLVMKVYEPNKELILEKAREQKAKLDKANDFL